jgi:hypothetical protein
MRANDRMPDRRVALDLDRCRGKGALAGGEVERSAAAGDALFEAGQFAPRDR